MIFKKKMRFSLLLKKLPSAATAEVSLYPPHPEPVNPFQKKYHSVS